MKDALIDLAFGLGGALVIWVLFGLALRAMIP